MKQCCLIEAFLFLLLAACQRPVDTACTASHPDLVAIDTLMQTRPDSALTLLWASPMEDPYYQLLFSEALYKNDSAQLNRTELLEAMAYYDSVACPFLSARCHYMNGVGYYEMDSVVQACEQYLKALEIMEKHYEEKDMVGYKAKFMALVYSRLCVLFTDQYLHVQAVGFAKQAYLYYQKQGALSWQSVWALNKIGVNYDMMEQLDSAAYYYQRAATTIDDSTIIYRDIVAHLALIRYKEENEAAMPLFQLKHLLSKSETAIEFTARSLAIGEIYLLEKNLDSAELYLNKVYGISDDVSIKKQAAEWLVEIHKEKGESEEAQPYAEYLVPFANLNENQGFIKSYLVDAYQNHEQQKKENQHRLQEKKNHRQAAIIMEVFVICVALVLVVYISRTRRWKKERQENKIKRAALAGRLKQSNEALKKELKNKTVVSMPLSIHTNSQMKYVEEPICRHILSVCNDERNPIKSNVPVFAYADIALTQEQKAQLKEKANYHYGQLFEKLKSNYPEMKEKDFLYFSLCLLGLDTSQIAVMMQLSYRTVWQREQRLKRIMNTDDSISIALYGFMNN